MQVAKAFSKSSGDQKLAGALRSGKDLHRSKRRRKSELESILPRSIRRSSVASLEELEKMKCIVETPEKTEEAKKVKKRDSKRGLETRNDDDDDDDDESHLVIIPPLFPEHFCSQKIMTFKRTWTIVVPLPLCYTTIMIPLDFAFQPNEDDQIGQDRSVLLVTWWTYFHHRCDLDDEHLM